MIGNDLDPLAFPGYRLVTELGSGHNATVYRARELESQRLVAAKVYRPALLRRAGFISGLDSAIVAARELKHPAAVRVLGLCETRDRRYLALIMELAGGEVLSRALQRNVRFPVVRALRLIRDMADAVSAAHKIGITAGIIHPGHVIVSGEGARLLGIGWSSMEGLPAEYEHAPEQGRFAPAAYSAPEMLSGSRPDFRSDVFSLGAVLYHMLTGIVPFHSRDLPGLKLERTEGLRWPRGADSLIPSEAIGLVGRALELDPALRPTAGRFSEATGRILNGSGGLSGPKVPPEATAMISAPLSVADLPPVGDGDLPAPGAAAGRGHRIRDILLGAVAATLLIGTGLALGKYVFGNDPEAVPAVSAPGKNDPGKKIAGHSRDSGKEPFTADKPDARERLAEQRWKEVEALLADPGADPARVKRTLAELSAAHPGSPWGVRARVKLDEILEQEGRQRDATFRKLIGNVEELARADKFGEAIVLLEKPPAPLEGTELAARCSQSATDLRGQALERWKEISQRAENTARDGDLARAILDYQLVIDNFGIAEYTARARTRVAELGREQEKIAARAAMEREAARKLRADKSFREGLRKAGLSAAAFRYSEALAEVDALAGDPGQSAANRRLATRYARMLREEKDLFQRAAKSVSDGSRRLTISLGGPEVLQVKSLDEKGMVALGGTISTTFKWDQVPANQLYRAIFLTTDNTEGRDLLALASFAWHRGLQMQQENDLKLAVERDPALKDRAALQAGVYQAVDALLSEKSAGPGSAGKETSRRRKAQ